MTLGKLVYPVVIEDCPIEGILSEPQSAYVFREGDAVYERLWKSLEPHDHRPWPPLDEQGKPTDPWPSPGLMAFSERICRLCRQRDPEAVPVVGRSDSRTVRRAVPNRGGHYSTFDGRGTGQDCRRVAAGGPGIGRTRTVWTAPGECRRDPP